MPAAGGPQSRTHTVPVVNRRLIATVVLGVILTACQAATVTSPSLDESPTPEPSASSRPEAMPSNMQTASPAATAQPTASPDVAVRADTVVATTVEGLSVRRSPGTEGEQIGFLELGTVAFVLDGPTDVNGVPWYRVTGMGLPYLSGCATNPPDQPITCPGFEGWVAGANEAGDPWLAPTDPGACPEPTIRGISEAGYTWRLVCWADEPITFDAWWPVVPDGVGLGGFCPVNSEPGGFLYCQVSNTVGLTASPDEEFVFRLSLSIDPASGVTMPARGQSVRVTGQFDHRRLTTALTWLGKLRIRSRKSSDAGSNSCPHLSSRSAADPAD